MPTHTRLSVLFSAVILSACSPPDEGSQSPIDAQAGREVTAPGKVFRRGNAAEPETLDPHQATGTPAYDILRDLYEGLTTESVRSELQPGAAESWEISEGGTRYVFHLREDGRWSNGEPVTAHDFVSSFRRVLDPLTASPNAQMLTSIVNADAVIKGNLPADQLGVRALDTLTLEIRLTSPTPYFLGLLNHSAAYPVHSASLPQAGAAFARRGKLISNGAYMLDDWRPHEYLEAVKNPYYWDRGNVAIERVRFLPIEEPFTELHQYRADEIDYTDTIPSGQLDWVEENLPGELHIAPYLVVYYYYFNLYDEPFKSNRKLRQALSMAIDRERIVNRVTGRGEVPAYGWVPPGIHGYANQAYPWKDLDQRERSRQAQRLFSEAGFVPDDAPSVRILYDTHSTHKRVAQALQGMWKDVLGIETELVNQEWAVYLQSRKSPEGAQLTRSAWVGDYNDPNTFLEIFRSGNNQNIGGYVSTVFDDLIDAAAEEIDPEKRRQLLREAEWTLLDDYAFIPIYFFVSKHLVKPYVEGFVPNVMDHNYSRHYRLNMSQPGRFNSEPLVVE